MGNAQKAPPFPILDNPARVVFVTSKSRRLIGDSSVFSYIVFTFEIRYLRFKWEIRFRFDDIVRLDRRLLTDFPVEMTNLTRPSKHNKLLWTHDKAFLDLREQMMTKYLQEIMDIPDIISHPKLRSFLGCCVVSFIPDLGRKGKEGWLKKSSGGYHSGFSRKTGDYITIWQWRWVVLRDNCIIWFHNPDDGEAKGSLQIDSKYTIHRAGRVMTVSTATRRVCFFASTTRLAEEWEVDLRGFYSQSLRMQGWSTTGMKDILRSSYPQRDKCQVKVNLQAIAYE